MEAYTGEKDMVRQLRLIITKSYILRKWSIFLRIIFDPLALVFGAIAFALFQLSSGTTDKNVVNILTIMIAIVSGISVNIVTKNWYDFLEKSMLVHRGTLAIRNLNILVGSISELENRALRYSETLVADNAHIAPVMCFEEIMARCDLMKRQALNAVDVWKDIIPEADVKSQITIFEEYRSELERLSNERDAICDELKNAIDKSEQEKTDLTRRMKERDREISSRRERLVSSGTSFGGLSTVLSAGSLGVRGGPLTLSFSQKTCPTCGTSFAPREKQGGITIGGDPCPKCGTLVQGF